MPFVPYSLYVSIRFLPSKVKDSEVEKPAKVTTKKGEKDGEGTNKLYGEWQTEPWTPDPAVNGKVSGTRGCVVVAPS